VAVNCVCAGETSARPPLLLVHGLGGRWQHWRPVIDGLCARRRIVALDLPGFGRTPWPAGRRLTLEQIADAVAGVVRELDLGPVVFVGHSFGGPLGVTFAARHAALVEQLVLVCGTVQSFQQTLAGRLRPWLSRPRTAVATVAELVYTAVAPPARLRSAAAGSPSLRAAALWPFVRSPRGLSEDAARVLIDSAGRAGVVPTARAIARATGWENLTVEVPVVLINGDSDLIAPLADLRAYRGRVDLALVVKDVGHVPMLERPDAFERAMRTALGK
jgi:cis-3-alkyl-4-acyloxetan-2-one decarboxylase